MPDVFFTVDPDGLDALKSQLEHIQGGMQDTGNAVDAYSPLDLGHAGSSLAISVGLTTPSRRIA